MLCAFGHPVAMCCDMLGVVRSNFKMVKLFMQHLQMLHDVVAIWPGWCNNVAPRHMHKVAKCMQHVAPNKLCCDNLHSNAEIVWPELPNVGPTMLGYVVLICRDHLAGA